MKIRSRSLIIYRAQICALFSVWLVTSSSYSAELIRIKTLPLVSVSAPSGYCEAPLSLELVPPIAGCAVRYTTDGSEPSLGVGGDYLSPLMISNTTVLRAAAFKDAVPASVVTTRTYIFLEQVIHQSANPSGFPIGSGTGKVRLPPCAMSPAVVDDPLYRGRIKGALQALPVLSIVYLQSDLFGAKTGIYLNSMQRGERWERPCSVEFIPTNGAAGFQIDCGIRIQGNYNRIPEKSPKHSFRLLFKQKHGASKLHYPLFPDSPVKKFDTLVLRADYNNS